MEGATDAEATAISRRAAALHGLTEADLPEPLAPQVFADATGRLTGSAIQAASSAESRYLRTLGGFGRTVTSRYRALLTELAPTPGELHHRFVTAMITGDLDDLETWLAAQYGPDAFARRFRALTYDRRVRPSPDRGPGRP